MVSSKQIDVLHWVKNYIETDEWGQAPTVREVGAAFGLSSPATAQYHLHQLEKAGLIKRGNSWRRMRLTEQGQSLIAEKG